MMKLRKVGLIVTERFGYGRIKTAQNTVQSRPDLEFQEQQYIGAKRKLTQRAYINTLAAFLNYGSRILVSLILNPIILSYLGTTMFGVWTAINRITAYLSVADGRPTEALKWVMANNGASSDYGEKQRSIGSAVYIWVAFLPISLLAGFILVWLGPTLTGVPVSEVSNVRSGMLLLVLNFVILGLVMIPTAVLTGANLVYKSIGPKSAQVIFSGICSVALLHLGWGIPGLAAAQLVVTIPFGLALLWITKKNLFWFSMQKPLKGEIRKLLKLSVWFFLSTLVNMLLVTSDIILLAYVISPGIVTVYVFTGFVANKVMESVFMINNSMAPGLGGLVGDRRLKEVASIRREFMSAVWLIVVSACASILLLNKSFISLYVGSEHYGGSLLNLFIAVMVVQMTFIYADDVNIKLTLDLRWKVILGGISALLCIGFAVFLMKSMGPVGLCIGFILGRGLLSISYPLIVSSIFKISLWSQFKGVIRPLLVMSGVFYACFYAGQKVHVENWFEFIFFSIVSTCIIVPFSFFSGLGPQMQNRLVLRVKKIRFFSAA